MTGSNLAERLATLPILSDLPAKEIKWLVEQGDFERLNPGDLISERGVLVEKLYIILSDRIAVRMNRGANSNFVMEWQAGEATGKLPFSRMKESVGNNVVVEGSDVLTIHERHFSEMISCCPEFTAHTVHMMLDRARNFKSSELQNEKMVSLGRLAAGLAHELNNPSSAISRSAELLADGLNEVQETSMEIGAAGLSADAKQRLMRFRSDCMVARLDDSLMALERADLEDDLYEWLSKNGLDQEHAPMLADACVSPESLNELKEAIGSSKMNLVLQWIEASCSTFSLAAEIKRASSSIYELVAAVEQFTYMDRLGGPENIQLESGIRDTVRVLDSKARSKNVSVAVNIDPKLPFVLANGAALNQVWMNLIDNALDAAPEAGNVSIVARQALNRVVVSVIDNGDGIPETILGKIFDPFFTTKPPGSGTGLGLEIARQIIRRNHGDIDVKSHPGRTEFSVSFPLG